MVNAVKWAYIPIYDGEGDDTKKLGEEVVLLSGSGGVSPEVAVWVPSESGENEGVRGMDYVLGHIEKLGGSVNDIAVVSGKGRKGLVVVTAGADGKVGVWEVFGVRGNTTAVAEGEKEEHGKTQSSPPITIHLAKLQDVTTKPKFLPLSLALSILPNTHNEALIMAVAGSTNIIQIYVSSCPSEEFTLRATLAGHENWVRSIEFTHENPQDPEGSDLLLASASQDKYIRLWRVHQGHSIPTHGGKTNITDGFGAVGAGKSGLSNKAHRFQTSQGEGGEGGKEFSVTFEALLVGHEDWIYTIKWRPTTASSSTLQLLSASADNSVSLWSPDEESGIWLSTTRLGEISDQKGSSTATGSAGGLWIGLYSPTGHSVAALGRTGGWRLWGYDELEDRWTGKVAVTGHVRDVTGVSWGGENGEWLVSTGLDQTTRVWARRRQEGGKGGWHEFSRPQIHGYDINCVTWLPRLPDATGATKGGYRFVSGADEKLLRMFEEPKGVAALLQRLTGSGSRLAEGNSTTANNIDLLPEGAEQPVLGLSNKTLTSNPKPTEPVNDDDDSPSQPSSSQITLLSTLPHPPLEDHLARHTLWPETEKLYGHGYEISAIASAHTIPIIATSCRASSTEHAGIRLFDVHQGREVKPPLVGGHSLTVLRMEFSLDDDFLLSVGRDRSWVVYRRTREGESGGEKPGEGDGSGTYRYAIVARQPTTKGSGAHSRVVWDGKWAPTLDSDTQRKRVFATGSRDKTVKIWVGQEPDAVGKEGGEGKRELEFVNQATIKFSAPVTALDFLPSVLGERLILAVGREDGGISIYEGSLDKGLNEWILRVEVDGALTPGGAVLEMKWRREGGKVDGDGEGRMVRELAVAGEDGSVRIYEVEV